MKTKKYHSRTEDSIKARVAPLRAVYTVKKIYAEGSPGAARKAAGRTLTQLKADINAMDVSTQEVFDVNGALAGTVDISYRDTVACTQRRINAVAMGLLGTSNIGSKKRHVRNSYAACNTKKAA